MNKVCDKDVCNVSFTHDGVEYNLDRISIVDLSTENDFLINNSCSKKIELFLNNSKSRSIITFKGELVKKDIMHAMTIMSMNGFMDGANINIWNSVKVEGKLPILKFSLEKNFDNNNTFFITIIIARIVSMRS